MTDNAGTGEAKRAKRRPRKSVHKRVRQVKPIPACSFEEALGVPNAIQKYASGQRMRRLTLFDKMGKSADSGPSRQMVTNASRYGLIKGNYSAEYLELTPDGDLATSADAPPKEKLMARFKLAIERITLFQQLYETQKGQRLPDASVLEDLVRETEDIPPEISKQCVDMFIVNAKYLGILKLLAGADRIISIEQALEDVPPDTEGTGPPAPTPPGAAEPQSEVRQPSQESQDWDSICFYISPIGDEDTEQRKHADLFLATLVEPALQEFKLKVIRADNIGKPGMITRQVIEFIIRSKLVIADLSYHNPNVFYELSLRHACRLPTVQIIRKSDRIPFDLDQFRTIQIDDSDIYSLVPNLQTYKAQIATQVRMALQDPDSVDNPLSTYYPGLKVTLVED